MKTISQGWSIYLPLGDGQREEDELTRNLQEINASEQGYTETTLLIDRYGNPLLIKKPRVLGFRKIGD
jgi:hypothetical protein